MWKSAPAGQASRLQKTGMGQVPACAGSGMNRACRGRGTAGSGAFHPDAGARDPGEAPPAKCALGDSGAPAAQRSSNLFYVKSGNTVMEKTGAKPEATAKKERHSDEELDEIINKMLDRHSRVYDRLAEI